MEIPSFDEFLLEMGEDRIAGWTKDVNEAQFRIELPLTPFNIQNFYTSILSSSAMIAKAMLRDYHEWLIKQLEQNSLRLLPK